MHIAHAQQGYWEAAIMWQVFSLKFESKITGELNREGATALCKQEAMKRRMMCVFSLGSSDKQESGQMTKDKYIQILHASF